ncbi:MAG: hypothetical protein HY328_16225 [Chloroflexi bacterium]|nr:hypothetical protein [Chloroflexota bacterium]
MKDRLFDHRNFLKQSLLLSIGAGLAACAGESGTTNKRPDSSDAVSIASYPTSFSTGETP